MSEFTVSKALSILGSQDDFPINLDDAWRWIGYKAKRNAKEVLINRFEDGVDFLRSSAKTTSGRPREQIMLTVDTFKQLGMMAGTNKGKEIRRYFLDCEKQLKQLSTRFEAQVGALAIMVEGQFSTIADRLAAIEAKLDQPQAPKLKPKQLQLMVERTQDQIAAERKEIADFLQYKAR